MKSEWKKCRLGSLMTFKNGKKRPETGAVFPVYGGNGVLGYADKWNNENCVVIGRVGAYCGSVFREKKQCWISDNAISGVSSNNNIDYLYYLLKSLQLNERHIGTSQPLLTQEILNNIQVTIPPNAVQKKIASILLSFDDKIELNNKINDNLEQQAQAIFRSWFLDCLPFNSIKPTSWKFCTLGETTKMSAGGDKPRSISSIQSTEYPYPIYSNGLDNEGLYGYTDEAKIFAESVTVSARGTIGFVCLRHVPYVPIVRLISLIPNESMLSAKYLYLYLKQLHISGTGTTQQQLTVPDFQKTEIIIPDKAVMDKFTNLISPIFNKIWTNKEENIKIASLRDSLLPKLMSGELDVSEIQL